MKNIGKYALLAVVILALLSVHIFFSHRYTGTMYYQKLNPGSQYYVFNNNGYDLLSVGMKDMASRMVLLYSVYTPVNMNIPSTNFKRLITALEGVSHLDSANIQPYLTVAYYWSWSKDPDNRQLMTDYLIPAVEKFPESWDIPYTVFRFMKDAVGDNAGSEENRVAMDYLRLAAERAVRTNGPKWIIDYPAILMSRDGETLEAGYWLLETLRKTDNPQQIEIITERLTELVKELQPEQAELLLKELDSLPNAAY
jgi:hypothetical protein